MVEWGKRDRNRMASPVLRDRGLLAMAAVPEMAVDEKERMPQQNSEVVQGVCWVCALLRVRRWPSIGLGVGPPQPTGLIESHIPNRGQTTVGIPALRQLSRPSLSATLWQLFDALQLFVMRFEVG